MCKPAILRTCDVLRDVKGEALATVKLLEFFVSERLHLSGPTKRTHVLQKIFFKKKDCN